jgi:gamma-glutamyl-gamma-aminobutyrate hydrolase PuuD
LLRLNYIQSILAVGGIPLILPPVPEEDIHDLLDHLSALLFVGGNDYCPSRYGHEKEPTVNLTHPARETFDFCLMRTALQDSDLPILGICAGMQLLNICQGGTLIQDIATALPNSTVSHSRGHPEGSTPRHEISISEQSFLARIYRRSQVSVPSYHHQAVDKLGSGLRANAYAEDGIIEGIEMTDRIFAVGVQYHPERDFESHAALFHCFVLAARQRAENTTNGRTRSFSHLDSCLLSSI